MSCGIGSTFCVAVDDGGNNSDGHALYFTGGKWSAPVKMDSDQYGPVSVSCIGARCVTVDGSAGANGGGSALVFDTHTWSAPTVVSTSSLSAVSCGNPGFCVAVNQDGYVWNGSSWSSGTLLNGGEGYDSISCPFYGSGGPVFCATVGHNGGAAHYLFGTWTYDGQIDSTALTSVSCVNWTTTAVCLAVDSAGNVFAYNGASWSGPTSIDPNGQGLSSISCIPPFLTTTGIWDCVAVDGAGNALTYDGTKWTTVPIDPKGQGLTSVSCASSNLCMAVDNAGNAIEYGPACVVPKLKGDNAAAAKRSLHSAGCAIGKITKRKSAVIAKGRVVSSSPSAGAIRPAGSKVSLVISSGKLKHHKR